MILLYVKLTIFCLCFSRGVSSTVRRCFEKSTHKEYAVKIIDLTQEKDNDDQTDEFRQATKKEIQILRMCADHPHISMFLFFIIR